MRGGTGNLGRRLPWPVLGALILIPSVVLVFFPDVTYNNYGRFVSWGAIVLGPLCAIQLVDFFVLRRQRFDVRAMYDNRPGSPYHFTGGFNLVAFVSMPPGPSSTPSCSTLSTMSPPRRSAGSPRPCRRWPWPVSSTSC